MGRSERKHGGDFDTHEAWEAYLHRLKIRRRSRKKRAREIHAWLVAQLGGRCQWPGCDQTCDLTIDHPHGRGWDQRRINVYERALRYRREYLAGVPLRCLCHRHNSGYDPSRDHVPEPEPVLEVSSTPSVPSACSELAAVA